MSNHDQCPSSHEKGLPASKSRVRQDLVGVTGEAYWRSTDDLADTQGFRDALEREFPSGASELVESSRRTFMKIMGAGLALAGVSSIPGCRQPDHKILPYSKNVPEDVIPGKPLFYASTMPLPGGGAEGVLVETHEGRPTKLEGNPLHSLNQGKSSVWTQSSVLDLYDPDRLKEIALRRDGQTLAPTWDDFGAWSVKHFAAYDATGGEGLAFISDRKTSPTLEAMRAAVLKRWKKATWLWHDALENTGAMEGLTAAMGAPTREVLALDQAKVIVSLDRDLLSGEAMSLAYARQFSAGRRVVSTKDAMNRLYAIESTFSITGGMADHRYRLAPSQIAGVAAAIAKAVLEDLKVSASLPLAAALKDAPSGLEAKVVAAIAKDLVANKGESVLVVGESQPAWVHALCAAVNQALGNAGKTVKYAPAEGAMAESSVAGLKALAARMDKGEIKTLVTLNANPVFDAPADLEFARLLKKVPTTVTLSVDPQETAAASMWSLHGVHFLEAWADATSLDGTVSIGQPMIAPLYDGKSDIEVLAMILANPKPVGYELVRETFKAKIGEWKSGAEMERAWRRSLHDGVVATVGTLGAGSVNFAKVAELCSATKAGAALTLQSMDVVFVRSTMSDGRFSNNSWLNELAHPMSKVVWDNPVLVSPRTAEALGVMPTPATDKYPVARMATITVGGKAMRAAVWPTPGIPDNTIVAALGWGRKVVGLVGAGVGFYTFAVRTSGGLWSASGATLKATEDGDRWYAISTTQHYGSMEGRAIVREADMPAYAKFAAPKETAHDAPKDSYGRAHPLNFAERLEGGELNHMPAPVPVYGNPYSNREEGKSSNRADRKTPGVAAFDRKPQWGMTIDLSTCIGCGVCTVACQSENNIPVVGKTEVQKGRNMEWIRIDRYFKGEDVDPTGVVFQPVACVHCENAPCEVVCPVNATVHGPEGHNFMTYNRCIGTRYCANNCPYKVRRFNFFDYGVTKFNGGYMGHETVEGVLQGGEKTKPHTINPNLIPPRLREKLDEISKMQKNPNVTVRSRGVMEKCTYCIQRTNEAKIELKLKGLHPETDGVPDGFVQAACQQACPTHAIVFGDILDDKTPYTMNPTDAYANGATQRNGSLVNMLREHERTYALLGFLATKPRTTHMIRLNNPNPELRAANMDPFGHEGGHGEEGGHAGHASSFVDPARRVSERGYLASLSVLGS